MQVFDSVSFKWFGNFDRIFIDINRIRRTDEAVDLVEPGTELWDKILQQQQMDGQFTVDIFGGTSFKINKWIKKLEHSTYLYLTVGVNNILNNKKFVTGGFEQTRLDYQENNVDKFPPNYFYAYGTNFFINATIKF